MMRLASLQGPRVRLDVLASKDFRDLVVFTPPHRHAVCLEPYTCITDAANLQAKGVDAGWRVWLPARALWTRSKSCAAVWNKVDFPPCVFGPTVLQLRFLTFLPV